MNIFGFAIAFFYNFEDLEFCTWFSTFPHSFTHVEKFGIIRVVDKWGKMLLQSQKYSCILETVKQGKEMKMTPLELTQDELEELISAESHMYMEYDEYRSNAYNETIRRYNDSVEELINKMKVALQQFKERTDNE